MRDADRGAHGARAAEGGTSTSPSPPPTKPITKFSLRGLPLGLDAASFIDVTTNISI